MPILDVRGFQITPDILGAARGGLQLGEQFRQVGRERETRERQEQIRQLLGGIGQEAPQTEQEALLASQTAELAPISEQAAIEQPQILSLDELKQQAQRIDPEIANQMFKQLGMDTPSQRAEASRFSAEIQGLPVELQNRRIQERAQSLTQQGRSPKDTLELLGMPPAVRAQTLQNVQLADLATKERLTFQQKQAAVKAKAISLEDVKSSKILDDGTTIQVMKSGITRVVSPEGVELEGAERSQAIKDAQEFGVDIQQRRAKGRELGKGAGKIALNAFDKVASIRENVLDYQRGIDLIEKEGATTGFIADFLPNMKASTRKFANLRRKLGLNVVASVTFGALSEGELNLAMDVALPKGISPEATVKWIKDRMAAQQKLADNLEDAALFLADHSVAELIKRNRAMAKAAKKKETIKVEQPETPPQGGIKFLGFE